MPGQDPRGIAAASRCGAKHDDGGPPSPPSKESAALSRDTANFIPALPMTRYPYGAYPRYGALACAPSRHRGAAPDVYLLLLWPRRLPVEHFLHLTRMKLVQDLKKTVYLP
jgi:hypothetical protein